DRSGVADRAPGLGDPRLSRRRPAAARGLRTGVRRRRHRALHPLPAERCVPVIRPMREDEADEVFALTVTTFDALSLAEGSEPEHAPHPDEVRPRYVNLVRSDPGGCWVAEEEGRAVGCAMAILREGIWGLSLLIVHPERQSSGLGRELLERA